MFAPAQQSGVEQVDSRGAELRHQTPVRGTGARRPATATVLHPEVLAERRPQLAGPLSQLDAAGSAVGVEQLGAQQGRAVGVGLCLASDGPAGLWVAQIRTLTRGSPQPGQTPFGRGQKFLRLVRGKPPSPCLRQEDREEQGGFRACATGRQVRPRVPPRPRDHPGLRCGPRELGARECPQGARRESGAERQCHPGRGEGLGRGHPAAPGRSGRQVGVGGVRGVAHEQGLEIFDGGVQKRADSGVIACRPCGGQRARRRAAHGSYGSCPVRLHAQFHTRCPARGQLELPAQESCRGQGVGRRRIGRDRCAPLSAGPAQARVVNAGGQLGAGPSRRDGAQVRQIGPEGHLHRQTERAEGRAVECDPFRAVRVPDAFDHDIRIRAGAWSGAQSSHETCVVRRARPGLDRGRLASGDTNLAAREHTPARAVEALQPMSGQLSVFRGNGKPRERDADEGGVDRRQVGGTARWRRCRRCGRKRGRVRTQRQRALRAG